MAHASLGVPAVLVSLVVFLASKWYCSLLLPLPVRPPHLGPDRPTSPSGIFCPPFSQLPFVDVLKSFLSVLPPPPPPLCLPPFDLRENGLVNCCSKNLDRSKNTASHGFADFLISLQVLTIWSEKSEQ
jgi:hypothetical protein